MPIKAVVFDMDETLTFGYDPERGEEIDIHFLSWQVVLANIGHDLSQSLYENHLRGATNRVSEHWLLEQFGCPLEEQIGDVKEQYYREHLIGTFLKFRPGVDACLNALRSRNIQLGLLTSAPRANVQAAHRALNLWNRIDQQLSLDVDDLAELKLEPKPAPDGLIEIQKRMNLSADELVYIGDSTGDMHAARSASITALGFVAGNDAQTLTANGAAATISHFDELLPRLQTLE